jgi:uncharacterized protein with HEPN domain
MRTDDLYLVDIIESATDIEIFVHTMSLDDFMNDNLKRSAILWKLMIISEASIQLSRQSRNAFVNAPWDQIRGFRNRMVHGYYTLKWVDVWQIVTVEIPPMSVRAEEILAAQYPDTFQKLQELRTQGKA